MKFQILFSEENKKKNVISLSPAELAWRMDKVNVGTFQVSRPVRPPHHQLTSVHLFYSE